MQQRDQRPGSRTPGPTGRPGFGVGPIARVQRPATSEDLATRYDRKIYEVCRIPDAGKTGNLYWPKTVDGYRAVWKGYLADPDLQDARARWPFVCIWDNHEFSWLAWQSIQEFPGTAGWVPAQTLKVAEGAAIAVPRLGHCLRH